MVKFTEADRHIIEVSVSGGIVNGEPLVAAINNLLDDYEMLKAAYPPVSISVPEEIKTLTGIQYPINWDAVQLHTQEVKHFFIPDHQSTAMMCEVCGRSELDSIHVTRKEYQR